MNTQDFQKLKLDTLNFFWGYPHFRDLQEQIIDTIISGNDTLALLPTGGGKSLCYQLPALLLGGTCIVISPLLALMKDQVRALKKKRIEAEFISSEIDDADAESIYNRCREGVVKILYISPERLNSQSFIENIEGIEVSFIAVDEAHCISEWGQDFRPSYQNIKVFREKFPNAPCLALTATATPKVLQEIGEKLGLKNPHIFQKSFKRDNLNIIIEEISDKYQRIFNILKASPYSGIIYTQTRKDTENLDKFLKNNGIENTDFYHAGLSTSEKNSKQKKWQDSNHNVLISTNAFGMGIDKENVRFVIHLSPPLSIENYYQEIGRAGRDGEPSFTFLFWSLEELSNIDDIFQNQIPNKHEFKKIVTTLYSIFQIADHDLPEDIFQLRIEKIRQITKLTNAKIKNVLNFLHTQEIIFLKDYRSFSTLELLCSPHELEALPAKNAYFIELLLRNIAGLGSHKSYFHDAQLSDKMGIDLPLIQERLRELEEQNLLKYIDGSQASIRFLKHRDDLLLEKSYWQKFIQIQKNKLQKWEEMKFYIRDTEYCKMRLILSYFGEKNAKKCNICNICKKSKNPIAIDPIVNDILSILGRKPATIDEISAELYFYEKERILENIILLLDAGKIKMYDFRTYTLG